MPRRERSWRAGAAMLLLALAAYQACGAALIEAKAWLAPHLIQHAWETTLRQPGAVARPWPWADTWPVARLQVPAHGVDLPILAGDSGNALAFAPGHARSSADLGSDGLAVVGGHRDTHFAFLADVEPGQRARLQLPGGDWREYRVVGIRIADVRTETLQAQPGAESLLLVTCYPFASLRANGPLRYVVQLSPV